MSAQVKPGYKLTEVGVIPEDWELSELSAVSMTSSGTTPARSLSDRYYRNGTINWVKTLDLNNSEIADTDELVTQAALEETCLRVYPEGTILVAMYGGFKQIGRTGLLRTPAAVNQAITAVQTKSALHSEYLLATLNYRVDYWRSVASSSRKDPNITSQDVRSFKISIPPIKEQRAIAVALSDTDSLISGLDQLIAKKRNIKKAAMQQLLTGQQRLPGFSGEWEVKRLGEIGVFLKGSGVRRDQSLSGDLPCIRYGEIYTEHNDYIREFKSYISVAVSEDATLIECGDIMFAGSGETKEDIGKCVSFIDDIEAYAGGDIVILRPKNVDSLFLGYALNIPRISCQKASRGQGDAVVHISANALATIEVLMPNQAEQTAIATILSDMDSELASLETRRDKASQLKQGMMQELLTGKTRLVTP